MDNTTEVATVFNNTYYDETMISYMIIIPSLCAIIMILNLIVVISSGLILKKGSRHTKMNQVYKFNLKMIFIFKL